MLAADNWCIKVDDKVYGPYTSTQLRGFAKGGRLASWSMIAPAGSKSWRPAREDSTFSDLFSAGKKSPNGAPKKFGRRDEEETTPSLSKSIASVDVVSESDSSANVSASPARAAKIYLVSVGDCDDAPFNLESVFKDFGGAIKVAANTWVLESTYSTVGLRNALTPYVGETQSLFIAETVKGKASWRNFDDDLQTDLNRQFNTVKN